MAVLYKCDRCGYDTPRLHCIKDHFKRKRSCKPIIKDIPISELVSRLPKKDLSIQKGFKCDLCNNAYDNASNRNRHQKECGRIKQDLLIQITDDLAKLKKSIDALIIYRKSSI